MKDKKNKRFNVRGVSPVIATILLIAMVIVIAMIIFLWFRGMTQETITKFQKNVQLVCEEVNFDADYSNGDLIVSNNGNVPIFSVKLKISGDGSHVTKDIRDISEAEWPDAGLNQGGIYPGDISSILEISTATEILVIPVLMGTSDEGDKTYVCEERFGVEVVV